MTLDPLSLGIGLLAGGALAAVGFGLYAARAKDAFRAASADALNANSQAFLALAAQQFGKFQAEAKGDLDLRNQAIANTVAPVGKTLEALNQHLAEIEKARAGSQGELKQHFAMMHETHTALRGETGRLVQALRTPMGRGSWGEMQLERLLEIAGMQLGIHYDRQVSASDEDRSGKPDIVVRLAGGKSIVIDAKTPMDAYITAIEASDDATRTAQLKTHAANVRDQMKKLGRKEYWKLFEPSPDFVVMFMPSEGAAASAFQLDMGLIEAGMRDNVVIATPMTLFALLRTVVYGWRQERLAENAAEIVKLGADLYDRIGNFAGAYQNLGGNLMKAVDAYNKGIGQIENRILSTARKLKTEHDIAGRDEIPVLETIEDPLRFFSASEMLIGETEN
jgi:DNA recombination protein RmuC